MEKILVTGSRKSGKSLIVSSFSRLIPNNKKIIIVNLNHENRGLETAMKVEDFVIFDILDYMSGEVDIEKSILKIDENIDILPSAYDEEKYKCEKEDYEKLVTKLEELGYDYVIIESNLDNINKLQPLIEKLIYIDNGKANYKLSIFNDINGEKNYIYNEVEKDKISSFEEIDIKENGFLNLGKINFNERYEINMDKGNINKNDDLDRVYDNFKEKRAIQVEKTGFFNWLVGIFKK